jgi:ribose transport system permease protein
MTVSEVAGVEQGRSSRARTRSTRFLHQQEATLLAVIVVICGLTALRNSSFLDTDNLVEILRSSVIYFVMGCGAALLVIGGGLDFSVGAVFTFGALATTKLMVDGVPIALAILAGLLSGAALGAVNHAVITHLHVPPIIATLGTYFIVLGVDDRMTGGLDVLPLPDGFQALGQGQVLWVPNVIWYAIIVGVVFWFLLERTRFGVNVRALGGNREAAVGNGLKVVRLDLVLYCLAGLTGALGGIIYSARVGAGQVQAGGSATTLTVITAVLIGGVSLLGGLGSITGVAVGAVLLSVIDNALIVARIPPSWNNVVVGAVLIAAVAVDHLRRQQLYKKK